MLTIDSLSKAAVDVLAERRRQIEAEGWTADHDDEHSRGEMARAASCYAHAAGWQSRGLNPDRQHCAAWPWDMDWWAEWNSSQAERERPY